MMIPHTNISVAKLPPIDMGLLITRPFRGDLLYCEITSRGGIA